MNMFTLQKIGVYVINLDRSHKRLAEITSQFNKINLDFTRVPAIDGHSATYDQVAQFDQYSYEKFHGKSSVPGELGCYLSHWLAINTFLKSDNNYAVILEDDVILTSALLSVINSLCLFEADWDMVKLSGVHSGTPVTIKNLDDDHKLCIMFSKCTGSSAYIINRKTAISYSNKLLPMKLPYDHEFDKGWKYDIKIRSVNPFPIQHNEISQSTITSPNPRRKFGFSKRIPTHIYRIQTEVSRLRYAFKELLKFSRQK